MKHQALPQPAEPQSDKPFQRWCGWQSYTPWLGGILFATLAFWKLRLIDTATIRFSILSTGDIYIAHYPMMKWGFDRLFSGDFPHWNPHQLTGLPFQAINYVGLLYPGNWIYGVMETGAATELSYIAHLFFAGAGAFALCRTIGFSPLASLMACFTFMWSGWMMFYANQPSLVSGMCWLPATVLLVELTLRGRRWAAFGLIIAVACQILNGATEFFVHNLYVAAGYTLLRLGEPALAGQWRVALRQGLLLLGCVAAGVALAAPQLLPTIELARESVRGATHLSLSQVRASGTMRPSVFIVNALMAKSMVAVGVLPLAGIFLGLTTRKRGIWGFALVTVVLSALLVFGGGLFELYYETPLGALFRRPNKFLHIYAFGQALMAALAVLALESWRSEPRRIILRHPLFAGCVLVLGGGAVYLLRASSLPIALLALIAGLLIFAAVDSPRLRSGLIAAFLLLQITSLFFGVENRFIRPAAQLEIFQRFDATFAKLAELSQGKREQRVHLTNAYFWGPELMKKSGMYRDLNVLGDYEPLTPQRAAAFFEAITEPLNPPRSLPTGTLNVRPDSDWDLLDLTSTRFYVVSHVSALGKHFAKLARQRRGSGVVLRSGAVPRIYERTTALPRAYFVPRARLVDSPDSALAALRSKGFSPRREVVLEGAPASIAEHGRTKGGTADVVILEDEPEEVVVRVRTMVPGFLVLNDAYYPGWKARSTEGPLPLYRANYLFRAVPVEAGETQIAFAYSAHPFYLGLAISGATGLALIGLALYLRRNPAPKNTLAGPEARTHQRGRGQG